MSGARGSLRERLQALVPDWVAVYVCVPDEEELEAKGQREVVFLATPSGQAPFHVQLTIQAEDRARPDQSLRMLYVKPAMAQLEGKREYELARLG